MRSTLRPGILALCERVTLAHANSTRHVLWRIETMALMSDVDLEVTHVRVVAGPAILGRVPFPGPLSLTRLSSSGSAPSGSSARTAAGPGSVAT